MASTGSSLISIVAVGGKGGGSRGGGLVHTRVAITDFPAISVNFTKAVAAAAVKMEFTSNVGVDAEKL
jgi:hypothetical protein